MSTPSSTQQPFSPWQRWALLVLLVAGLGIRVAYLDFPPLETAPTRQYRCALLARGWYLAGAPELPDWKRAVITANLARHELLEPPLLEGLAVAAYTLTGGERLWLPRLFSVLAWLGAASLVLAALRPLLGAWAALGGTAFMLLVPMAVAPSRALQPDPLMILALAAAIWAALRHDAAPTRGRLAAAAALAGVAVAIKAPAIFFTAGALAALGVHRAGPRWLRSREALALSAGMALPAATYYAYGIFGAGFLGDQASRSFMPGLLLHPAFWKDWLSLSGAAVGYPGLVAGLLGLLLARGPLRAMLAGLWAAYGAFGLAFTYHIHTHPYYHLPLVLIVALSLGPVTRAASAALEPLQPSRPALAALGCLALLLCLREARFAIIFPDPSVLRARGEARRPGQIEEEAETARQIGELLHHSTDNIYLAHSYGYPLEYHGWIGGVSWPTAGDLRQDRLLGRAPRSVPERFDELRRRVKARRFVITDLHEYRGQGQLRALLQARFRQVARGPGFIIYDLEEQ